MNRTLKLTIIVICLSVSVMTFAEQTPTKLSTDARIEVVAYDQNNVVPIHAHTFTATQITFGKDETIEDVQCGDMAAWTPSINQNLPYMMFLKPTTYNSNTNMTVVTNQHTYYFHLMSNKQSVSYRRASVT